MKWQNENKMYKGNWKDGKQHGKGTLVINGKSKDGVWEHGEVKSWINRDSA